MPHFRPPSVRSTVSVQGETDRWTGQRGTERRTSTRGMTEDTVIRDASNSCAQSDIGPAHSVWVAALPTDALLSVRRGQSPTQVATVTRMPFATSSSRTSA
jgi:hypothetical protein